MSNSEDNIAPIPEDFTPLSSKKSSLSDSKECLESIQTEPLSSASAEEVYPQYLLCEVDQEDEYVVSFNIKDAEERGFCILEIMAGYKVREILKAKESVGEKYIVAGTIRSSDTSFPALSLERLNNESLNPFAMIYDIILLFDEERLENERQMESINLSELTFQNPEDDDNDNQ